MPHPDREHSLQIQLATALRERDEAVANTQQWLSIVEKLRDNLNKTLLERDDLRAATANANKQTADLNALRLKQDAELVSICEALAAARRECEGLRAELAAAQGGK